jgi:hypothetical protein
MTISRRASAALAASVILLLSARASAQVVPTKGALEFSAASDQVSVLSINALRGGTAYVLTLRPEKNFYGVLDHIELVMRRPRARADAPNLLEPPYRWHGWQEYDFNGIDFTQGLEHLLGGVTRTIHIKNRKLNVRFTVAHVAVHPAPNEGIPNDYAFDKLVLNVEVNNAK